ncbi:MAG: hypothetical protein ACYDBH_25030, partial [Acidobacteriaceae bacterium]
IRQPQPAFRLHNTSWRQKNTSPPRWGVSNRLHDVHAIALGEVLLHYIPAWTIKAQSPTRVVVDLYKARVIDSGFLKPQSLAASSSTQLKSCQTCFHN